MRYTCGMSDAPKKPEIGPIAAMIIIVAIFVIGGIYFFLTQEQRLHQQRLEQQELPQNS